MSRATRFGFALLLGLALAASPSWAAGPRTSPTPLALATRLWSLLTGLWAPAPPPQTDAGCGADPHGGCLPGQAPAPPLQTDEGCGADPHGGCSPY